MLCAGVPRIFSAPPPYFAKLISICGGRLLRRVEKVFQCLSSLVNKITTNNDKHLAETSSFFCWLVVLCYDIWSVSSLFYLSSLQGSQCIFVSECKVECHGVVSDQKHKHMNRHIGMCLFYTEIRQGSESENTHMIP